MLFDAELTKKHKSGALLWCLQMDQEGGLVTAPELSKSFSDNSDKLYWVHLQSDADGASDIMASLGLDADIIESLTAFETRPRTVITEKGTMMYLRGINRNPSADPDDMVSLRFWITTNLVVTARRKNRKLLSVLDVKDLLDRGIGPKSAGGLVCSLIEKVADRINETVDEIDEILLKFEQDLSENPGKVSRMELAALRRQSAAIRRYLAPQRDALETLNRNRYLFTEAQGFDIREQTDRMTRYVEDLDLARERAMVLQDELRNQIAELQGQRMYVLSIVTAIFLPLSFLTGIFGMNVAGLPGLENPNAFTTLSFGMLTIAILGIVVMKIKSWL